MGVLTRWSVVAPGEPIPNSPTALLYRDDQGELYVYLAGLGGSWSAWESTGHRVIQRLQPGEALHPASLPLYLRERVVNSATSLVAPSESVDPNAVVAVVYGGDLSDRSQTAKVIMQVKDQTWLHIADGARSSLNEDRRDAHSLHFLTPGTPDTQVDLHRGVVQRGEEEHSIASVYLR